MPACPTCGGELRAVFVLETRDDERPVYTDYQWWRCIACDARFVAMLEEDKTNIFNDDLDHAGYHADAESWQSSMERTRRACNTPRDKRCDCHVHTSGRPFALGEPAWRS